MQGNQPYEVFARIAWRTKFALAFLAPWVVAIGLGYAGEKLVPGQIKVEAWRFVASTCFIVSGVVCAYLAYAQKWPLLARLPLVALVVVWSAWFAFMFQLRSNCGDETEYIGQKPAAEDCE